MSNSPYNSAFHQFEGYSLYDRVAAPLVWPEQTSQQIVVLTPWGEASVELTVVLKGKAQTFEFSFPDIGIIPPKQLFSLQSSKVQPLMILCLELKPLLRSNPEVVIDFQHPLTGQYGVRDSVLQFIVTTLRDRYHEQSIENIIYCRSLVNFLLIHLITTYRPKKLNSKHKKPKSPENRLDPIFSFIEENLDQELKVASLAEQAEFSSPHFCRIFKKSTGLSPHRYILLQRINKAKKLLESSTVSLADIALQCGFYDQSHFNLQFRNFTGMTPKAYRDTH